MSAANPVSHFSHAIEAQATAAHGLAVAVRNSSHRHISATLWQSAVVTSEQTENHKPHPEPVLTALERLGSKPEEAAFVGDSPFDMGAGKAAGVFTVAVSWGKIHPVERLLETGADAVVHSPEELLDVL